MSTYEVGSVLWIIHTDRPGLMAYRVIEEITKKTLDGEEIQYLVQAAKPKTKSVKLNSIKGQVFEDHEEAKMKMIENATRAIDNMVAKIQSNVDRYFQPPKQEVTPQLQTSTSLEKLKEGYQWMELEDGTKAQIKIPEILK